MRYKNFMSIFAFMLLVTCGGCVRNTDANIERAVRDYVVPTLNADEDFEFVGKYNRRDVIENGAERVRVGVIYNINHRGRGASVSYDRDAVLTEDCRLVISLREHDTDVNTEIKNALNEQGDYETLFH